MNKICFGQNLNLQNLINVHDAEWKKSYQIGLPRTTKKKNQPNIDTNLESYVYRY